MVYYFVEFGFPVSSYDRKTEFPSANFVMSLPANAHPKSKCTQTHFIDTVNSKIKLQNKVY